MSISKRETLSFILLALKSTERVILHLTKNVSVSSRGLRSELSIERRFVEKIFIVL